MRRIHLGGQVALLSRCMSCDGDLVPVAKEDIADRLPEESRTNVDEFAACVSCDKVFWPDAHHPGVNRILAATRLAEIRVDRALRHE